MNNIIYYSSNITLFFYSIITYIKYKRKPKYSFFIIKFRNNTNEVVLYKNAYKLKNSLTCYNMYTFNKIQKDDILYDLDDWSRCLNKTIPVWNFKQLYNFVKACKKRKDDNYLYEYSLIINKKDIKKILRGNYENLRN